MLDVDFLKWKLRDFDDGVRVFVVLDGKRYDLDEKLLEPQGEYAVGLVAVEYKEKSEHEGDNS